MPLTGDHDREESANYGYFLPPTPIANGPYVLDVRINAAHLPGGVLGDFSWSAWDGVTGGPLLFIEPQSKSFRPQGPIYASNQFKANGWFKNWYRKFKSVKFKFNGTDIVDWRLAVDGQYIDSQGAVITRSGDSFSTFNLDYTIWKNNAPGTWKLINVTEVPIPAGGLLLIGAVGLLTTACRRRKERRLLGSVLIGAISVGRKRSSDGLISSTRLAGAGRVG